MIWTLIYQPPPSAPINAITTIDDWVVPPNWEPITIVANFEERFPGSTVISLFPSEAAT
jgi:hypothetical protein